MFDKLGKSQLGRARRHLFSSEVTIRITEPIEIKKIERKIGLLNRELKIFDDISSSKDANAQKSSLKGLYGIMNTIKLFLDEQLSKIPFDKAHDDKIIANYLLVLTHLEKRFWELAGRLNEAAAKLLKVSRVGPGERPDAYKGPKPELKLTKEERAFLDAFTKAKSDKPKSIEEAYTGIFAMRTYKDFEKIAPWQGKGDVEYSVGGKPWDQKVVYWGETEFDGRLKTTHTKFGFATHNQKVGILMDVTFVKKKNYEKTWLKVFGEILGGDIASEYIREVKNKDAAGLIAALHVNLNEKPKTCIERNIIFMEQVAKESKPFCTISSKELDKEHLRNIINGTKAPFCLHSNNRGWLPMNIAYFEYSISKKEFKGKLDSTTAKYVVSTDRKHIYLTPSHYKGFTITTKAKEKKNRPPFYRVLLSDDLKSEGKKMNLNKK